MTLSLPDAAPTAADLDRLYAPPAETILKAMTRHLTTFHLDYLRRATFFCLATGSARGLDASPRGGPAGFVKALGPTTVAFADWPGNNRIESLRNLQDDDRVGMLFVFPGLDVFMRLNGRGRVSTAPDLLAATAEAGRTPKSVVVVTVEEALFHCGKAVRRAALWDEASRIDAAALPSVGKMLIALADLKDVSPDVLDAHYAEGLKGDLY